MVEQMQCRSDSAGARRIRAASLNLRDEGINFYRLLLEAGVAATCRQVMGTSHGVEVFPIAAPDISREAARSIADFCRGATR